MKQGVATKNFEDVCELVGGSQPAKDDFIYEPKDGYIRLIQVRDYRTDKYITYIPKDKARRFCNKEDIMIGRYGPPIFGIFKGLEGAYNVALMKAVVNEKICNKDYFYWFLNTDSLRQFVEHSSKRAAGQDGVRKELLDKYPVFVPPLPEQLRIVSILDEAFAAIAKAKANAEQNLKNAKELFESYLQGVFENKGEGWEEKTIEEIIESNVIGLTKNSSEQRSDYEYKYVKMNNITRDNHFDLTKYTCVNATKLEAKKYSLSRGDFLFNTRNSYELVGKTCLFEGYNNEVILYNNNIMRIRFIKTVNPHFINYSFTTPVVIKKLNSLKSGTTNVSAIYYKDLKNLKLLIPPIKAQQIIVQKLDALSAETKKLEAIYQQKINDLEELKKSVLQKAFSGELKTGKHVHSI